MPTLLESLEQSEQQQEGAPQEEQSDRYLPSPLSKLADHARLLS